MDLDKDFLIDLLSTPSPSGYEVPIQKKWKAYVERFADRVETDLAGNVYAIHNPDASFKVLLAGHCDEIGMVVQRIDEKGFLYINKIGGISPKNALGMKVNVLGYKQTLTGVIGANAEHHGGARDKLSFEDLYIDCGAKSKEDIESFVQIGDPVVYKNTPERLLNDRFCGRGLDNRTGAFIVAEVLRKVVETKKEFETSGKDHLLHSNVGIYAVSTVNEETNMGGAYFAAAGIQPTMAIACDVTFATDYPGVNRDKHGEIDLDQGPVLAKGAPINPTINRMLEKAADRLKMNVQYELTPQSTGTDADKMRLTGPGVPVALLSLPLRYMHAPMEVVSLQDMQQEVDVLVHTLLDIKGHETLKPLID